MSWQSVRRSAFLQMVVLWPISITYKAVAPPSGCIATSTAIELEMQRNDMMPKKPVTFSILREDFLVFQSAGMAPRETIQSYGSDFQIYGILDDPSDATVDLRCTFKV
jgi:hypothetical protein